MLPAVSACVTAADTPSAATATTVAFVPPEGASVNVCAYQSAAPVATSHAAGSSEPDADSSLDATALSLPFVLFDRSV